jgi:single-stranded-DNA-specific exonuclease
MVEAGAAHAVAPILAARGLAPEDAADYLEPSLRKLLPNPSVFLDMDKAVKRVAAAITGGEKIAIWGDYDVDGATSSAILARFLGMIGIEPRIYIPDRIKEGYGPNAEGFALLRREGCSVVCILDSGTVAFETIEKGNEIGLDSVVIDHHAAEAKLPKAMAVVNPNRLDQPEGYGHVCAAGMTFIFCVGLNAALRDSGWYGERGFAPNLMALLDLVALGTVADVVPLTTINRAFVRQGLTVMSRRSNPGIAALSAVTELRSELSAYHCGFVLGPRINAGGRVGAADSGAQLLSSDDPVFCMQVAQRLDAWNSERRELEKACTKEAIEQIDAAGGPGNIVFALGESWHEGVIGIVASRLKEAYDRPSFVFTVNGSEVKGSGRSVRGFDLGNAVIAARRAGILSKGGGHAMAAGASMPIDRYEDFKAFMEERIASSEFARTGVVATADVVMTIDRVSVGLIDSLSVMEPYGQGNPRPRFLLTGGILTKADLLKEAHLRIELTGPGNRRLKGIAFNVATSPLTEGIMASIGKPIEVLGTLDVNEWNGTRTAQVLIEDARLAA